MNSAQYVLKPASAFIPFQTQSLTLFDYISRQESSTYLNPFKALTRTAFVASNLVRNNNKDHQAQLNLTLISFSYISSVFFLFCLFVCVHS